jgi:hypothetical protein
VKKVIINNKMVMKEETDTVSLIAFCLFDMELMIQMTVSFSFFQHKPNAGKRIGIWDRPGAGRHWMQVRTQPSSNL